MKITTHPKCAAKGCSELRERELGQHKEWYWEVPYPYYESSGVVLCSACYAIAKRRDNDCPDRGIK